MSKVTPNLGLYEVDPTTDGSLTFNIQTMINDNLDLLDAAVASKETPAGAQAKVNAAITALLNGAPGALDTLKELADAMADDASFATTMTNVLALKAPLLSPAITGIPTVPTAVAGTNTAQAASTAFVEAARVILAAADAAHLADVVTDSDGAHALKIESGTWTPKIAGTSTLGNHAYTTQFGEYIKENKKVTLKFKVELSTKDSAMAGNVIITGIPFAAKTSYVYYNNFSSFNTASILHGLGGSLSANTITLSYGSGTTAIFTNVVPSDITDTTMIAGELVYFTN